MKTNPVSCQSSWVRPGHPFTPTGAVLLIVFLFGFVIASAPIYAGSHGQFERIDGSPVPAGPGEPTFVVDFGSLEVGFIRTVGVGYSNIGGGPISNIVVGELGGNDPGVFAIVQDNCTGAELAPGESCSIFMAFEPPAAGDYSAEFVLTSSSPDSPELVRLVGTGVVDQIFSDRFQGID
ncbi:MAG: hypothetical protein EA370_04070 [Wenzhouxiangella sp.]|nr:MAG: hypothetical protein EA370_04070 [Wenzhouxiangella sp.]